MRVPHRSIVRWGTRTQREAALSVQAGAYPAPAASCVESAQGKTPSIPYHDLVNLEQATGRLMERIFPLIGWTGLASSFIVTINIVGLIVSTNSWKPLLGLWSAYFGLALFRAFLTEPPVESRDPGRNRTGDP